MWNSNQVIFLQPPFPKTKRQMMKFSLSAYNGHNWVKCYPTLPDGRCKKIIFAFNMQPLPIYIFCQIMLLFWGGTVRYKLAQNGCGINRYLGSLIPAQTCFVFLLWKILITFL